MSSCYSYVLDYFNYNLNLKVKFNYTDKFVNIASCLVLFILAKIRSRRKRMHDEMLLGHPQMHKPAVNGHRDSSANGLFYQSVRLVIFSSHMITK